MKLIIAGSRKFNDYQLLEKEVDNYIGGNLDIEIISGTENGADQMGEDYAKNKNLKITQFHPNREKYGKKAGPIKNEEMAKYATDCIVFIVNGSTGSANMIKMAKKYKLNLKVVELTEDGSPTHQRVSLQTGGTDPWTGLPGDGYQS